MEKIQFETEEGVVEFYILSQTRISGIDYLLVSESDDESEETEVYILKDVSDANETDAAYEFIEDEQELDAVCKVFAEELGDEGVDLVK